MPVVPDEAATYGYTAENRHMVQAFLDGRQPDECFEDGLLVTELLMACYLSAELGETIRFPVADLDDFVPKVAQGTWDPRALPKG
jgi:predicted dehydrogenase